ncbi:LysE family translocator [Vibrio sp. RM-69-4]|uniref:LysE family translocator n=1 Tax=Vibrio sp. RM-69-4 TaxID=2950157 RepID=UPI00215C3313|nr:LysE family translocator [Vibrio sp. RM-69-4]MCR9423283.1 LysE family translocator [Vibrio sp. RM-69-4]
MDLDLQTYMPILAITGALTLGAMSPGPSFIFVARRAISLSRRHGIFTALGMGMGALVLSVAALLGLQTIFSLIPVSYLIFKIAGGCYLLFLAFGIVRSARIPLYAIDTTRCQDVTLFRSYLLGLGIQLSNPKTAIVFASVFTTLLPQNIPMYFFIAVPICTFLSNAGWYLIVALVLSASRPRQAYLKFKKFIDYLSGSVMGVLGLKLIISR